MIRIVLLAVLLLSPPTWLAAVPFGLLVLPASADEDSRPNVLMIIADDLNDWVGCLGGHPDVRTPNIDRLARRGLLFTNAHCAAPVCYPSRVATFTGRGPSTTGIYDNSVVWHEALPGIASIPQHFKANGYYAAGGGKIYHHMPGVAPGVTCEQSRTDRPVGFIDLFPTLNELRGLPTSAKLDGVSLMPLLKESQRTWNQPALTRHGLGNHALHNEKRMAFTPPTTGPGEDWVLVLDDAAKQYPVPGSDSRR